MLKIYLARHGQDVDNANGILNGRRDLTLTAKGIEQAKELAEKIKQIGLTFDKIYCSPLVRAKRTAEIVAEELGIDRLEVKMDLIERDFGVMTGKRVDQIAELCAGDILKASIITYFLAPEGAETYPQSLVRARKVLDFIKAKHQDGNILLVTHGDFGKMIYAAYYNLDWKDVLTMFHFGNSELLELSEETSAENAHVITIEQHNH